MSEFDFTAENMERWRAEKHDPELEPYLTEGTPFGTTLQHPLVYDIGAVLPGLNNLRLRHKKQMVADAVAAGDTEAVVGLHERPYRLQAFVEYVMGGDAKPLWEQRRKVQKVAEWVWVDSENIGQHREGWLALYAGRPDGGVLGNRKALAALPSKVTLYRGGNEQAFLSWSTDRAVAEKFSRRGASPSGLVHTKVVDRADIFAYYTSRGESEALIF